MLKKLAIPEWKPDFGPASFNAESGATAIGARDFLIAYNINLNTTSTRRANAIAFDVREVGRIMKDPETGKKVLDENGEPRRQAGTLKGVKGIGWYIEEYGIAQISMNITDIQQTPLHMAFEECHKSADRRGLRVTGSELVGLVPLKVLLDAGRYFLKKQQRSVGVSEEEIIKIAVKSMGLDELTPFDPQQKIIEYNLSKDDPSIAKKLIYKDLQVFANETASESVAPGGGSVSAYVGALGISLGTMVANLSSHKRGWDARWEEFSEIADQGQQLKDALLRAVDEDTDAFNAIMAAFGLPKGSEEEKQARQAAIEEATKIAIEVPMQVVHLCLKCFPLIQQMVDTGNPNSVTDAGVGALCARAAVHGAALNVKVNAIDLKDREYAEKAITEANSAMEEASRLELGIMAAVQEKMGV